MESKNSNSQILREFFAMRCHVKHTVVSMRELYSKNQILTALKQDTQICMVLSSRQNMNMINRTCGFSWLNDAELFSLRVYSVLLPAFFDNNGCMLGLFSEDR